MKTEKEFLIQTALDKYNKQFGHNIQLADCNIKSLVTRVNFDLSYEIWTKREDDYLRLRMHLTFHRADALGPYRLENDGSNAHGSLTDEVFVAVGRVDSYWKESGIYKFSPIEANDTDEPVLLLEDGTAIFLEDDTAILNETAVI